MARRRMNKSDQKQSTRPRSCAYLYWSSGRQVEARAIYSRLPEGDDGFAEFLTGLMKPYMEPEIAL
jgi:hypothetical protein